MGEYDGTKIGADGRRYAVGDVPTLTRSEIVGTELRVFGDPADGEAPLWSNDEARAEWGEVAATEPAAATFGPWFRISGDTTVVGPEDGGSTTVVFDEDLFDDGGTLTGDEPGDWWDWHDSPSYPKLLTPGIYEVTVWGTAILSDQTDDSINYRISLHGTAYSPLASGFPSAGAGQPYFLQTQIDATGAWELVQLSLGVTTLATDQSAYISFTLAVVKVG